MDSLEIEKKNDLFKKYLSTIPRERLEEIAQKQREEAAKDFQELKEGLEKDFCSICSRPITDIVEKDPCLHWLISPKLKNKYLPLLFENFSYHKINNYLRWVANTQCYATKINNLVEEGSSSKKIEMTIQFGKFEWSFSSSQSDFRGHADRKTGTVPHYHFQMKIDGKVIFKFNGNHLPFHDEDFFDFAMESGEFEQIQAIHFHGAGMQEIMDSVEATNRVDLMRSANSREEAQFLLNTVVQADPGTSISGKDLQKAFEEHKKTGIPVAHILRSFQNVSMTTFIEPGPGVPVISKRTEHKKR